MNIAAGKALAEAKEKLAEAVATLRSRLDSGELAAFDESQEKWQVYCDAWANVVAGERAAGGTIWPMIFAGAAQATIDRRIEELRLYRQLSDSR